MTIFSKRGMFDTNYNMYYIKLALNQLIVAYNDST